METKAFFDQDTNTLTYVVYDAATKDAIIIDPVLNFDYASGTISEHQVSTLVEFISQHNLSIHYILETHAHADHLSSAQYLKRLFPSAQIAIGKNITEVQDSFNLILGLSCEFHTNGAHFDRLLVDNEVFSAEHSQSGYFTPQGTHLPV